MRLHRLTVSAFGPFAETVDIDFDAVAESGLFLIHGATGAGKTSLLDAVCFALYADVPGARSGARALRSDHAPRDAVPRVVLEFTASGRRFTIERSPEFLRPKKRGAGETRSPARVVLRERVGGEWVGKDIRPDDVAAVVRETVGIGLGQFSKVVMLPQGEFAAFLRATAEERRQVLERLFDVQRFTDVEDWLAGQRRDLVTEVDDHRRELAADLDRLGDLLAEVPASAGAAPLEVDEAQPEAIPAAVSGVVAGLSDAVTAAMAASEDAMVAETAALQASADGSRLAALQERARVARLGLQGLQESAATRHEADRRLALARRALRVSGHLDALDRAQATAREAEQEHDAAVAALRSLGLATADHRPGGSAMLRAALQENDEAIRHAARLRAESEVRREHLTRLRDQVRAAEAEAADHAVRRGDAEAEVERRRVHADRCERARAELRGLRSAYEEARRLHQLRLDHDAAAGEIERLGSRRADLRDAAQDARQTLLDLREARLAGMAAELAHGLAEGCACPVCGATQHPQLAQASDRVAAEDLELAEEQSDAAAGALEQATLELATAEAAQQARAAQLALGGAGESAALAEQVTNARAAMRSAQHLADDVPTAAAALQEATAEMATAAAADDTARERLAGLKATLGEVERSAAEGATELAALLQAHADACPCWTTCGPAVGDRPSPDDRHWATTKAARTTVAAEEAVARASALVAAAEGAAREALSRSGFDTPEEAAAAALDEPTMAALEQLCREHDESRIAFEATLDDPDVAAAEALPVPDLLSLDAAARHAQSSHVSARSAQALAERTLRDVSRLRDRIEVRCAAYLPVLRRSALLRDLADTVAGTGPNNTRRMRLSSFVLAARLENVARLANERLAVMGEGRYRLQHSDELAARGARSGLGLEVLDLWTGQSRATSTLSGGEAFMASLALALGLADAVREEAGGFDLQTLFIDEGFGTLDDESLEQVLGVLDELREGGRAVGVVSHVAELRSRISSQIVVRKTAYGSSVTVRGGRGAAA